MKPKKRQKLCYNCEGEVDLDVIVCPFCAADLREEKPELQRSAFSAAASSVKQLNTEHSLYPSSYLERAQHQSDRSAMYDAKSTEQEARHSYQERDEVQQNILVDRQPISDDQIPLIEEEIEPVSVKNLLAPVVLLTCGVHLFMLAMALLFLSHEGALILKWDARFWILYLIASAPLMAFGYRMLSKL